MQDLLLSVRHWAGAGWRWLCLLLLLSNSSAWAQTNDDCAQAVAVAVSANCAIPVNGSVAGATPSLAPTPNCNNGATTANDVWYSFVATGASQVVTLAPRFNAVLDVRTNDCAASTSVFCAAVFQGNTNSTAVTGLTQGTIYLLRVYATAATPPTGINSTFALCIAPGASTAVPVNDDCAGAIDIPVQANGVCGTPTLGDNTGGGASAGVPVPGCGSYVGGDIWFKVTVPAAGAVTVQTVAPPAGSPITDTGLALYSGTCTSLALVDCNDDAGTVGGFSMLTVRGRTPGEVLYVRVWEFGGNVVGPVALCARVPLAPANDDCAGAVALTVSATCTPTAGTLENATQSLPPTANCGTLAAITDVWYSFVATASTQALTMTGNIQSVVDVRSGTCASSTSVFCSVGFGTAPRVISGLTAGQPYFLRIYASNNQPTPGNSAFTVCLGPAPVGPANDECAGAVALPVGATCGTATAGTVAGASQSLGPTTGCLGTGTANDVWYSFVANGPTQNLAYTGNFQVVADVRSGTCASSTSVYCGTIGGNQTGVLTGLVSGQSYFLRLYAIGTLTPAVPTFTVCLSTGPTPPTNDECAGALPLPVSTSCGTPTAGTYLTVSQSLPPTTGCGTVNIARDVWYTFVATGSTQTVNYASTFGGVVDVRTGTCASSSSVFCGTTFTNQPLTVTGLTSGQAYFLRLYPSNAIVPVGNQAPFTICLTAGPPASPNDECAQAVPVSVVQSCATSTNGTVEAATQSLPPTAACGGTATTANDVWYSFVAAAPTQLITLTARFTAVMEVRSGTCAGSSSVFCNAIGANTATGTIVGGLTTGQTYFIRIYSANNFPPSAANSTFTLCINPAPTPPANDNCAQAVPVPVTTTCAAPVSGTVESASQSLSPTTACGNTIVAQDVWYSFVASGVTQLVTLTPRFSAVLDVRTGTCASSTSLVCTTVNINNNTPTLLGGLTAGTTYYMRVYAGSGVQPTPINATFTLCVTPGPTPPANDECATATPLTVNTTCVITQGSVSAASQSLPPGAGCGPTGGNANDIWYSFVATGPTQNIAVGTPTFAVVDVRTGTCANSTSVFCSTQASPTPLPQLVGGLTTGQTYYVRIYSTDIVDPPVGARGDVSICITPGPPAPANDDCAGAIDVPVQYGSCVTSVQGSNNGASGSTGVPAPGCGTYTGGDIWFKTTVPASGILTVQTVQASIGDVGDTGLAVYAGTCAALSLVGCDDDSGGNRKSRLQLTNRTPGEVLYIRVWSFRNATSGNLAVCVSSPIPPCADPTALAAANITPTGADVSWTPGGTPATGTTYTVIYGPQGFDPLTGGTTITGLTAPGATLASLTPATAYCFYVRQTCPIGNASSALVGPVCFTTAAVPVCPVPTNLAAASLSQSGATLNWAAGGAPTIGTTFDVEYGVQGFVPGAGTMLAGLSSSSTVLTGLLPATAYCFYVRQQCPAPVGSGSAWVGPVCFTTSATQPPAPGNDEPCGAVALTLGTMSPGPVVGGSNVGATTSAQAGIGATTCATNLTPRDVWYSFTSQSVVVDLYLTGAAAGLVRVFTAPDCAAGPYTLVACQSSGASNTGLSTVNLGNLTVGLRYYVAVSGYGPNDTSGGFTIGGANIPLGTRNTLAADVLQLFPNPSHGAPLTMRLSNLPTKGEAVLLNALGQQVLRTAVPAGSSEQRLATTKLAAGLYTLRIAAGADVVSRKVVLD